MTAHSPFSGEHGTHMTNGTSYATKGQMTLSMHIKPSRLLFGLEPLSIARLAQWMVRRCARDNKGDVIPVPDTINYVTAHDNSQEGGEPKTILVAHMDVLFDVDPGHACYIDDFARRPLGGLLSMVREATQMVLESREPEEPEASEPEEGGPLLN